MPAPGEWTLSWTSTSTFIRSHHVQACPDIGPPCDTGPQTPYLHHSTAALFENDLGAEVGLAKDLSAVAVVPFRAAKLTIRYTTLAGQPYVPPDAGIHHRNETLLGPGDPSLMIRAGHTFGRVAASLRAGSTLPAGKTQPNPFTAGRLGKPHEHFQFGSGIFEPVGGVDGIVTAWGGSVVLSASGTLGAYRNAHGLRPSSRADGSAAFARPLGKVTLSGGIDLMHEWAEHWKVDQPAQEGNLGRTDLTAIAMSSAPIGRGFAIRAGVSLPLYTKTVGEQSNYPGAIQLGVSWSPLLQHADR